MNSTEDDLLHSDLSGDAEFVGGACVFNNFDIDEVYLESTEIENINSFKLLICNLHAGCAVKSIDDDGVVSNQLLTKLEYIVLENEILEMALFAYKKREDISWAKDESNSFIEFDEASLDAWAIEAIKMGKEPNFTMCQVLAFGGLLVLDEALGAIKRDGPTIENIQLCMHAAFFESESREADLHDQIDRISGKSPGGFDGDVELRVRRELSLARKKDAQKGGVAKAMKYARIEAEAIRLYEEKLEKWSHIQDVNKRAEFAVLNLMPEIYSYSQREGIRLALRSPMPLKWILGHLTKPKTKC